MKRFLRRLAFALEKRRSAFLLWPILSIYRTIDRHEFNLSYRDRDGDWVDRSTDAVFFSPIAGSLSLEAVERNVREFWCYAYSPKPGDTVVDIGAGIGNEAVAFSRMVGPSGRVIAVEAHPRTFRCLKKTISMNRLTNVIALNVAISDRRETLMIADDEVHHIGNRIGVRDGVTVQALSLDDLLDEIAAVPDLLKMNIEGAERPALMGVERGWRTVRNWVVSCHDFIAAEVGPEMRTHADVIRSFEEAGLKPLEPRRHWGVAVPYYVYAAGPARAPGIQQEPRG